MSSGNAGAEMLGMLVRLAWWVIRLIPSLVMFIFRGIKGLVNMLTHRHDAAS